MHQNIKLRAHRAWTLRLLNRPLIFQSRQAYASACIRCRALVGPVSESRTCRRQAGRCLRLMGHQANAAVQSSSHTRLAAAPAHHIRVAAPPVTHIRVVAAAAAAATRVAAMTRKLRTVVLVIIFAFLLLLQLSSLYGTLVPGNPLGACNGQHIESCRGARSGGCW